MPLDRDDKQRRWEKSRQRAMDHLPTLTDLSDARVAIEYLIAHDSFVACSKEEFALILGWTKGVGREEKPDRLRVERVCNLTRDQDSYPEEYTSALGGYVIAYAPSSGGMTLLGDGVEIDGRMYVHLLTGDLQKQQSSKTINRRRLPTWRKVGEAFAASGDVELSRLFFQAEDQIDRSGVVDDSTVGRIFSTLVAQGVIER